MGTEKWFVTNNVGLLCVWFGVNLFYYQIFLVNNYFILYLLFLANFQEIPCILLLILLSQNVCV